MGAIQPGEIVAGRYRIERRLGRGGMGEVFLASHTELGAHVALKVIRGEDGPESDRMARFLREATAASSLRSEHVARVQDYGSLDDGSPFMVLEFLEGEDLEARSAAGPLPISEAVDAVLQACVALAEAHAKGLIHRDLKPSNLFATTRPDGTTCVKVLDFGVAKLLGADPSALTSSANPMGTPLYMSPEQLRTPRDVDARTDVWALGVVLFELVAGRRPFEAESAGQVFAMVLERSAPSLRQLRADVPEGLSSAVARCLEKDMEQRWRGVSELAEALAPFASSEGALAAKRAIDIGRRAGAAATTSVATADRRSYAESALAETALAHGPGSSRRKAVDTQSDARDTALHTISNAATVARRASSLPTRPGRAAWIGGAAALLLAGSALFWAVRGPAAGARRGAEDGEATAVEEQRSAPTMVEATVPAGAEMGLAVTPAAPAGTGSSELAVGAPRAMPSSSAAPPVSAASGIAHAPPKPPGPPPPAPPSRPSLF